jgi:hypothetical protein
VVPEVELFVLVGWPVVGAQVGLHLQLKLGGLCTSGEGINFDFHKLN